MTTSVAEPERPGAVIFKAAPVPGPRTYGAGAGAAEKSGGSATLMACNMLFFYCEQDTMYWYSSQNPPGSEKLNFKPIFSIFSFI